MNAFECALTVAPDHPAYAGHFPGQPILPGVVLLDAAMHAIAAEAGQADAPCQVRAAKFLSPVAPGEPLTLRASPAPGGGVRFEIVSGTRSIASGVIDLAGAAS